MRIARVRHGQETIRLTGRDGHWDASFEVDEAAVLAPAVPAVIVGISHNPPPSDAPPVQAWYKPAHAVAGNNAVIQPPTDAGTIVIEGELAMVVGTTAHNLTLENALDHVLGYTIANDVTNADQAAIDNKFFQGKGGGNYAPLGPWIETELPDPDNTEIIVYVNGEERARSGTQNLPSTLAQILVYVTRWITLEPGDVVMTGSPSTSAVVESGDVIDIVIPPIGTLRSSVA